MLQSAGDLRFHQEPAAAARIVGVLGLNLFERDFAMQFEVLRDVDLAQAAVGMGSNHAESLPRLPWREDCRFGLRSRRQSAEALLEFRVGNLPPGFTVPVLALGLSNTVAAGPPPYPLPFDLGVLGWPGCQQLVSLESTTASAAFGTFADFPLAIPLNASLLGFVVHGQGIVFYSTNAVAVTNGVTAIVGV